MMRRKVMTIDAQFSVLLRELVVGILINNGAGLSISELKERIVDILGLDPSEIILTTLRNALGRDDRLQVKRGKHGMVTLTSQDAPRAKKTKKLLSPGEFVALGIEKLRNPSYKGLHVVWSGLNDAFRRYYGSECDPVAIINALEKKGVISTHIVRGGVNVFTDDLVKLRKSKIKVCVVKKKKKKAPDKAEQALKKMGLL